MTARVMSPLLCNKDSPKNTTIRIDQHLMGQLAMDLIVKLIKGEEVEKCEISSDHLIVRDTVKKI
jgi:DNA-binding LacI/PurR family transcriptional regulator